MKNVTFLILFIMITESCCFQQSKISEEYTATLFLVHDNYPKNYDSTMGKLSYTRNILLAFIIKNHTDKLISLPISNHIYSDTTLFVKVTGKGSVNTPLTYYRKHSHILSSGDSMIVAIHLNSTDLEKLVITQYGKAIEQFIPHLQFECYQKGNEEMRSIRTDIVFKVSPNILYKHGRLYIEYSTDGKKKEKEVYENSKDIEIVNKIILNARPGIKEKSLRNKCQEKETGDNPIIPNHENSERFE